MAKPFSIACKHCKKSTVFVIDDIPELGAHIADEIDEACEITETDIRFEVESEFEGHVDGDDLLGGSRPLQEMAIALRRGDIAEAERLLDGIAEEIGARAVEDVQQGRYSLRVKVAA